MTPPLCQWLPPAHRRRTARDIAAWISIAHGILPIVLTYIAPVLSSRGYCGIVRKDTYCDSLCGAAMTALISSNSGWVVRCRMRWQCADWPAHDDVWGSTSIWRVLCLAWLAAALCWMSKLWLVLVRDVVDFSRPLGDCPEGKYGGAGATLSGPKLHRDSTISRPADWLTTADFLAIQEQPWESINHWASSSLTQMHHLLQFSHIDGSTGSWVPRWLTLSVCPAAPGYFPPGCCLQLSIALTRQCPTVPETQSHLSITAPRVICVMCQPGFITLLRFPARVIFIMAGRPDSPPARWTLEVALWRVALKRAIVAKNLRGRDHLEKWAPSALASGLAPLWQPEAISGAKSCGEKASIVAPEWDASKFKLGSWPSLSHLLIPPLGVTSNCRRWKME